MSDEIAPEPKPESWLKEVLDSNLVAAIIGFVSALFVYYLTDRSQSKKKADEDRRKYLVLLSATMKELLFYQGKLATLSEKLAGCITDLKKGTPGIILPSFSVYPEFLEQSKIQLNSLFQNASIVQKVGHCHFELCHVLERLNWLKGDIFMEMVRQPQNLNAVIANLDGIKGLLVITSKVFGDTASTLNNEITNLSRHV